MLRNVSSQRWRVYAWDTTTGQAKTGDAANISAYITKDDGTPAATDDAAPTEASSTNEPGYYDFSLTQSETDAAKVSLSPKSSTSDIAVIACPPVIYTRPQYFSLLGIASDGDLNKVNTLDGHTAQTGDAYARLGAPAGASVSADIAAVKGETADILEDTGTTLPGLITTVDTVVDGIKAVTDALPDSGALTSIATASALATVDSNVDAILEDTGTTLPGTLSTIAGYIDTEIGAIISAVGTVDTVVDGIKAVTDNLPDSGALSSLATASALATVDSNVDAILEDTGTTLPGTLADIPKKNETLRFTQVASNEGNMTADVTIEDAP